MSMIVIFERADGAPQEGGLWTHEFISDTACYVQKILENVLNRRSMTECSDEGQPTK